ncbi:MAG: HAD-IA family hydrolase [Anaerolineaceae bacterium]
MNEQIEGILFDMGGTLRSAVTPSPVEKAEAIQRILDLLGVEEIEADELYSTLRERGRKYQAWAQSTLLELNEQDLWTKWMLPDWPAEIIRPIAIQLNEAFRDSYSKRIVFSETVEVVTTLFRRGYRLGLVSNTTSSVEIPQVLRELNIRGYFDVVCLSALEGRRKPDDSLLRNAAERMQIPISACVYIGDQPKRDVAAAQKAGFARAIILKDPRNLYEGHPEDENYLADATIHNLKDLLDLFPARQPVQPLQVYKASLSTMFAGKNFINLSDFCEFARRNGFASVELNHKINTLMLGELGTVQRSFSSIHEPCPADIPMETLVKKDWQVSSIIEENRLKGVIAVKRSIDLASKMGIPVIVIHLGNIHTMDVSLEKRLRKLHEAGLYDSAEFTEVKSEMIRTRQTLAPLGMESLKKSLTELLAYAIPLGVKLGLENRSHYREFPNPDELEILLGLADPDQVGFIYDVGHAQHLSRLGFYQYDEWLKRFSQRIFGTHLHDVIGLNDHFAAGLGEVNYEEIATYLPENAFRTCEFLDSNSPEQVQAGIQYLFIHKCVKKF